MDVTAWCPGFTTWFVIDVTVRSAAAVRYVDSSKVPGVASSRAEKEKERRYGSSVIPLAFEHGGRMGEKSMEGLDQMADAASVARPDLGTRRNLVLRWRRRLESAMVFAEADALLLALSGSGQKANKRTCNEEVAEMKAQAEAPISGEVAGMHVPMLAPSPCLDAEEEEAARWLHGSEPPSLGPA